MRLFEIASEFRQLRDIVENDLEFDEETGEITDNSLVIAQLFNELGMKLSDKLDNSSYIVKQLEVTSDALKEEAKRLNDRSKALQSNADKLKELMLSALMETEEKKIKTDKWSFSTRKSESVDISYEFDLFGEYVRVKEVREPDKTAIKTALKNGEILAGASIIAKTSLTIK